MGFHRLLRPLAAQSPASPFAERGGVCPAWARGWHNPSDTLGHLSVQFRARCISHFPPELRCQEPAVRGCAVGGHRAPSLPARRQQQSTEPPCPKGRCFWRLRGRALLLPGGPPLPRKLQGCMQRCRDCSRPISSLQALGMHADAEMQRPQPARPHIPQRRGNRRQPSRAAFQVVVLAESLLTLALVNKEKPKLLLR